MWKAAENREEDGPDRHITYRYIEKRKKTDSIVAVLFGSPTAAIISAESSFSLSSVSRTFAYFFFLPSQQLLMLYIYI